MITLIDNNFPQIYNEVSFKKFERMSILLSRGTKKKPYIDYLIKKKPID
jgi:hypothetical protein